LHRWIDLFKLAFRENVQDGPPAALNRVFVKDAYPDDPITLARSSDTLTLGA